MLKILLVKTSSMGDVIHNLPVVTDIRWQFPDAVIDWVVEESFVQIPLLHAGVRKVIPVALRRWRKSLTHSSTRLEMAAFNAALKSENYDVVLDTQGLVKSAVITRLARGRRLGYDWNSAREPLASLFYQQGFSVDKTLHAVARNRLLASAALGNAPSPSAPDYGIAAPADLPASFTQSPYAVLLHGTSREDKLWPEDRWIVLGRQLVEAGLTCLLPWGSDAEKNRSLRLASAIPGATVPSALTLKEAASMLAGAAVVVGVDTGLTHLAAALGTPVVALYVATSPGLTGVYAGHRAINLGDAGKPPTASEVWQTAARLMDADH